MRVALILVGILPAALFAQSAPAPPQEPAGQLIREVAYNELRDHQSHGFWRYWIEQHLPKDTRLEEQVETADGPLTRLVRTNGRPLDPQSRHDEEARIERLVNSPQERAIHHQAYLEDEKHIGMVVAMLPDAFVYEYAGDENGCHHLRYRPSPSYVPRTIEARIIHSMTGDLWIDVRAKRLARLDGHLDANVDFGFGLLGRIDKGGWFRMERTQVSPVEWKMVRLEVHMSGHAVLFKAIAKETSEVRGGFAAVPSGLNLAQGMRILEQLNATVSPAATAQASPVSFPASR
jgi:hypothetical protein